MSQSPSRLPFNFPRHSAAARILGALAAFGLAGWFNTMIYNFRAFGTANAIGVATGIVLLAFWAVVFVHRVLTAPAWPQEVREDGEFIAGFVVVDLIVLNVVSPFFEPLAHVWRAGSIPLLMLSFIGRLSGPVLFGIFILMTMALVWLIVVRLARRLVRAGGALTHAQRALRGAAIAAVALYGIWATLLSFNGSFDRSMAMEYRREVVAVRQIKALDPWIDLVSWLDLRAADGTLERVTLLPGKDGVWARYADPGDAVVVSVRRGAFGIPWVERVAYDADRRAELLVEAAPSASVPRRALIAAYLRQGRGHDAVKHTRAYLEYYPHEVGFAAAVASTLRKSGDVASAVPLEQIVADAPSSR